MNNAEWETSAMLTGNKIKVIQKIIDLVAFIDENQNSIDMQESKKLLMMAAEAGLQAVRVPVERLTSQQEVTPDDYVDEDGKHPGSINNSDFGHNDDIDSMPKVLPDFNLTETIDKIKEELS